MKTARQVKSVYDSGQISFLAAHTTLRSLGYTDSEAEDILLPDRRAVRRPNRSPNFD